MKKLETFYKNSQDIIEVAYMKSILGGNMTENLKKYLKLYKQYEKLSGQSEQEEILDELESLYYELDEEDILYLEEKDIL